MLWTTTQSRRLNCRSVSRKSTTAITSLYLKRRFVGWDINPNTFDKTKEVIRAITLMHPKKTGICIRVMVAI